MILFVRKTPPIRDDQGKIVPGSIASLEKLVIGGLEQWVLIRGHDRHKPLLLMLHGGPGTAQIGWSRPFWAELERHFVVVNWDQRGAGLSFSSRLSSEDMTIERLVEDTHEMATMLLRRFGQPKLHIVGHSWGSVLGVLAAQRYPELFHSYVGVGQIGSMVEGERLSYELTLEQARKTKHRKAIAELESIGGPPYRCLKDEGRQRHWLSQFRGDVVEGGMLRRIFKSMLVCSEYTLVDVVKFAQGCMFSLSCLGDELNRIDLIRDVPGLEIPVLICQGQHDWIAPSALAKRFYDQLEAPLKKFECFQASAHCPNLEENDKFAHIIIDFLNVDAAHVDGS